VASASRGSSPKPHDLGGAYPGRHALGHLHPLDLIEHGGEMAFGTIEVARLDGVNGEQDTNVGNLVRVEELGTRQQVLEQLPHTAELVVEHQDVGEVHRVTSPHEPRDSRARRTASS